MSSQNSSVSSVGIEMRTNITNEDYKISFPMTKKPSLRTITRDLLLDENTTKDSTNLLISSRKITPMRMKKLDGSNKKRLRSGLHARAREAMLEMERLPDWTARLWKTWKPSLEMERTTIGL